MKIKIIALVAGMAFSAISGAATFTNDDTNKGANQIEAATNADGTCELLNENVRITLSASVEGGYECDTGTNVIAVSMCHPNGRKTGLNNNYYTTSSSGGKIDVSGGSPCAAADAAALAATAAAEGSGVDDGDGGDDDDE